MIVALLDQRILRPLSDPTFENSVKKKGHIVNQRNLVHTKIVCFFTSILIVYLYLSQVLESVFCPVSFLANAVGIFLSFFFLSFFSPFLLSLISFLLRTVGVAGHCYS